MAQYDGDPSNVCFYLVRVEAFLGIKTVQNQVEPTVCQIDPAFSLSGASWTHF